MRKWTNEQIDAINARERSVIVSAAAGSGKTSVLVERLIRIISDRDNVTPVEKMIVVTFTNDAAMEMKQRLSMSLSELMEKHPDDKWLSRQHSMLSNASISTIHSFCFELIRDNISSLSLSSDFKIIDDVEEKVIKDSVLEELLNDYYVKYPKTMKLLNENFSGNNDLPLCRMILELYSSISSVPFFENWLKEALKKYDTDFYINKYCENISGKLQKCIQTIRHALSEAEEISDKKIIAVLDDDLIILNKLHDYFECGDYKAYSDFLTVIKQKKFPSAGKEYPYPEERIAIKNMRDKVKDSLKQLSNQSDLIKFSAEDLNRHKDILSAMSKIIVDFSKRLYSAKERKNAIGFDDAEQIVLNLLAEFDENGKLQKTKLANELSDYYELIMIDEFQDSNNRQDMIFRLLSKDGSADDYGKNLFFVGDVKQSIYRFRLANPDNFINAVGKSVPYCENDKRNSYIKLNKNFRSSDEVINFVNFVFENIMTEEVGDILYTDDEKLVRGAEFSESNRNTHILLVDKSQESEEDVEAIAVVNKIREMLDNNFPVSIDNGNNSRSCEMRDFCILLRNRKKIPVYAHLLEKYGMSANCEEVSGYLKSREISILLNLLRVIDNPMSDIPLTSVMLSPMFMFTAEELVKIRLVNKENNIFSNIYYILENKNIIEDEILIQKIEFLKKIISGLRLVSSFLTLPELIRKIYDSTDFMSVIQLYKDAERKKANLRMLIEYANSYEVNSGGGISGFLKYIDRITESKGDFNSPKSSSSSQNAVSIKTMHKSKGLEFPFVFVAETSSKFSIQDKIKSYQFSSELGIGYKLQNKDKYEKFTTIPYEVISGYNQNKLLSEEMRLLYVALTRAREKLFIAVDVQENECKKAMEFAADINMNNSITPLLVSKAKSMGDWILMCLLIHSKSGELRKFLGIYDSIATGGDFAVDYEECGKNKEYQELINVSERESIENFEIVDKLNDMFNFEYDYSLSELSAKVSVSDITKKDDTSYKLLSRPLFMQKEELTGTEKGTALHKFLQFADFQKIESDFENEKKKLLENGYISKKQSDSIQYEDIEAFLKSNVFKMIKSAKAVIRERKFLISISELNLENEIGEKYFGTDGMLNGIADMIIDNGESLVLVDYKTDKISNLNVIAEKYRNQIYLYKTALEIIEKKPVDSAIIYSFYNKVEIKIY